MSPHSNSATLSLPPSLSRIHPTFNTSLLKPYVSRDPSLGPPSHSRPPPIYSNDTGQYYLIERIVAEKRSSERSATNDPIYTLKWVGYPHKDNSSVKHSFLINEPGGRIAIEAWRNRQQAIPTTAPSDWVARHRYRGSKPDPPLPPIPELPAPAPPAPIAPAPAPPAPPPVHAPIPAAPSHSTCSGRVVQPSVILRYGRDS